METNTSRFSNETRADKRSLSRGSFFLRLWIRLCAAFIRVKDKPLLILLYVAFIALSIIGSGKVSSVMGGINNTSKVPIKEIVMVLYWVSDFTLLILMHLLIGTPIGSLRARNGLLRAGVCNNVKEAPLLIRKQRDGKTIILTFAAHGIPLHLWQERITEIQSALNIHIGSITELNPRRIVIEAVSGRTILEKMIPWNDKYADEDADTLTLGKGYTDLVKINLADMPHLLVAGGTGSGKTVLAKSLIFQSIKKGYHVIIADLKRGGDYPPELRKHCTMCYTLEDTLNALKAVYEEMEKRYDDQRESGAANTTEYNAKHGMEKPRIVVAVDELAELLDRTGRAKPEKELIEKIESLISSIARLGRAANITLLLAMQRPDAQVLNGQIKNNIQYRVCGRADNTLSILIMDDARAEEQIPKAEKGLFINQDNLIFRGFWHDNWTI